MVQTHMDQQLIQQSALLQRYLFSSNITYLQEVGEVRTLKDVSALVTYFDLPINVMNYVELNGASGQPNFLRLLIEMKKLNLNLKTIRCIADTLRANV